jgi:hypothetical protein
VEQRENDAVQNCHWMISLLKRWLLKTHAGAVRDKHQQGSPPATARPTALVAARVIESSLVAKPPTTMRQIIDEGRRCRWYRPNHATPA